MKAGQQRLNRWNTTNSSFQNRSAENRPTSSQKVIESRQESTRYDRLRRVKSAIGSQRELNPNAERLLKRSKAKLKQARPARHFKAWDDREMPVPLKSEIHRKDKLKTKLPVSGGKNTSRNFANMLRSGASLRTNTRGVAKRPSSGERERKLHKLEAERARIRMRKAKNAALKAKLIEQQQQHVRRVKKLDTTIRPVLGNRTNQLADTGKLMQPQRGQWNKHDEHDLEENDRSYNSEDIHEDYNQQTEGEGSTADLLGSLSGAELEEANRWNPTFGNMLSPLPETLEEDSQSLSHTTLKPYNPSKSNLNSVHTIPEEPPTYEGANLRQDELFDGEEDAEIRIAGVYNAVSPPRTTESMKYSSSSHDLHHSNSRASTAASVNVMSDNNGLGNTVPPALVDEDDCSDAELRAHRQYQQSCKHLSASLDQVQDSSDEDSSSDEDDGAGVERLARTNFYSGKQEFARLSPKNVSPEKESTPPAGSRRALAVENEHSNIISEIDSTLAERLNEPTEEHLQRMTSGATEDEGDADTDYANESFAEQNDDTDGEHDALVQEARAAIKKMETLSKKLSPRLDEVAENSPVWDTPRSREERAKAAAAALINTEQHNTLVVGEAGAASADHDGPEWDSPRSRRKDDVVPKEGAASINRPGVDKQSPHSFARGHMSYLRDIALKKWSGRGSLEETEAEYSDEEFENLEESAALDQSVQYSDDDFEEYGESQDMAVDQKKLLRSSINNKFRDQLKEQLRKELSHSDLATSLAESTSQKCMVNSTDEECIESTFMRKKPVAFVC